MRVLVEIVLMISFGILIGIPIGVGIESHFGKNIFQKQAIEHNCAQYNQTTGQFEWKVKP